MKNIYISILLLYLLQAKEVKSDEEKGVGSTKQNWSEVTVREGAHYFWWLYHTSSSKAISKNKPLLISLPTGILNGASGVNNFDQIGPLDVDLNPRDNTWLKDFNILFIDNILGCGFSYVDNETNYASSSDQMGEDTFAVIKDFFNKVPEFRTTPTYMMSENSGTVITAKTALIWSQAQKNKQIESNLKAVVLGAPWVSLVDVVNFWAKPSNKDKFSEEEFKGIEERARIATEAEEKGKYWELFHLLISQVVSIQDHYKLNNVFNLSPSITTNYSEFVKNDKLKSLMNNHVKNVLRLGHEWKNNVDSTVLMGYGETVAKPIKQTFDQILKTDVRLVVIAGENDLFIPAPSVTSWVNSFNWENKEAFQAAKQVDIDNKISMKKYGNLEYYIIEAGHWLIVDNPQDLKKVIIRVTQE
ncbi:retinoid-inducible serine carboxypeptidase-like [Cotesia glomerata]|uniref:retinoid-inducible serine carboxypeptidase-like n=1 Tax=Cotesia glomerata TaxID=32391 RepID=UPI001D0056E8|nr:retinoid-inducible serine carboxypeptidase-like [Cotesia glomerata]